MKRLSNAMAILTLCACSGGQGILQPQMKPAAGEYAAPAAESGGTPVEPWTATTYEAAVNNKPLPGSIVTVVGEVVDVSCYLQLGKHGAAHRDCAQKCMRNGQPIGLLPADGVLYILMEEEHHPRRDGGTTFREAMIELAAQVIEVTGTLSTTASGRALYVQGYLKK